MTRCLMSSFSESALIKMVNDETEYKGAGFTCAPLIIKVAMNLAIVDTRATSAHLRSTLTSLDTYMTSVNSDIQQFNLHVKQTVHGLQARGIGQMT